VGWVWYAEHTGEKMSACKIFGMKTWRNETTRKTHMKME
jgi:hypothetical protein